MIKKKNFKCKNCIYFFTDSIITNRMGPNMTYENTEVIQVLYSCKEKCT